MWALVALTHYADLLRVTLLNAAYFCGLCVVNVLRPRPIQLSKAFRALRCDCQPVVYGASSLFGCRVEGRPLGFRVHFRHGPRCLHLVLSRV